MFPNLFSASPAVWAGLIGLMVALPLLIHLINMLRHRRVKWAAMDFLLQSHKRQRNWVRLKQLFLLLARMTALVLALFMLAQVGCQDQRLAGLLGGQTTHHYIVVDDSYSMGETQAGGSALDRARETVGTIGTRLAKKQNQRVTLLRFSQAVNQANVEDVDLSLEQLTDINGQRVDSQFAEMLEERRNTIAASNLATSPLDALEVVRQLIEQREGEAAVVYLLSDFRNREWQSTTQLAPTLSALSEADASLQMIRCATVPQGNLSISRLEPRGSIRSAGVPVQVDVEVTNHGTTPIRNLTVRCFTSPFSELDEANGEAGEVRQESELPTVFIDEIGSGKSAARRFPVFFNAPGKHAIRVQLPDDVLLADNQRHAVLDVATSTQAMIVELPETSGAFYVAAAFQPGRASSGVAPLIKTPDELRDFPADELANLASIYFNGVNQLDPTTLEKLETFVAEGGGLGIFVNENTDFASFNAQFYRGGEGLSPMPLDRLEDLPISRDGVPDVVATEHPLLEPFRDANDSFLNRIQISRFVAPPLEWSAETSSSELAALVRGDTAWPLVVEKRFGRGTVSLITTSADPAWNNWQRNPSFLVMLLRLQERLAQGRFLGEDRLVGQGLDLELSHDDFRPDVAFEAPTPSVDLLEVLDREAVRANDADDAPWQVGIGPGSPEGGTWTETQNPGVYTAWTQTLQGDSKTFRWSLNVDASEGDLQLVARAALRKDLDDFEANVLDWDELDPNPQREASSQISRWLLPLLLLLLIGEQLLAYSASYHPLRAGVRA